MSIKFIRPVFLASLFSLPLVLLSIQSAFAGGKVTFTLINRTTRVLEEFYASPPSVNDWEDNIFGKNFRLRPGEETEIVIDDQRDNCLYDFKGVFGPGVTSDGTRVGRGELIESAVEVCDGGTYEYFEQ